MVARLGSALRQIEASADFRALLARFGMEPSAPNSPEQFAALVKNDRKRWAEAVAASGARVE